MQSLLRLRVNIRINLSGRSLQGHILLGKGRYIIPMGRQIRARSPQTVKHQRNSSHTPGQSTAQPRPSHRTAKSQQYLNDKLSKEYSFKRESVKKIFKLLINDNILTFLTNSRVEEEGQTNHPFYYPFYKHIGYFLEECYVFKDRVEMQLGRYTFKIVTRCSPRARILRLFILFWVPTILTVREVVANHLIVLRESDIQHSLERQNR